MSSFNNYGSHSAHADFAGLKYGKPVFEKMKKSSTMPQELSDSLSQARKLKGSSDKHAYEVVFTYEIQRPTKLNVFKTEEGDSFTCFKHDKELTDGEIKEMALDRITENRFKGCRIIDLNICHIFRRF
jgi:hypothetical protein